MTLRSRRTSYALAGATGLALLLAACGGGGSDSASPSAGGTPTIVATTTVMGSIAGEIAECAGGSVTTVIPVGADPHDFSPSSADVATMVGADVVIANGLGLEEGLQDALGSASEDGARVIEIAPLVDPIEFGGHSHEDEAHSDEGDAHSEEGDHAHEDEHDHGSLDPHVWFDMNRMADAATIIGDALAETGGETYATCGQQVADEIRAAEGEVRALLESVPADKRVLVTDHDALGYLAEEYGYEVAGVVIPGGSTLAEPSSAELSALVETIRAEGVTSIFANTSESGALAEAVAAEAGGSVQVVTLYIEGPGGPGSGAETYVDMMRENARLIAEALRG